MATLAQTPEDPPVTVADIPRVLEQHRLWLETDGVRGARADLRGLRMIRGVPDLGQLLLTGMVLREVDLRRADIRFARLEDADLTESHLEGAELDGSDLERAMLYRANLSGASIVFTNRRGASLVEADLDGTIMIGADLSGADLTGARCLTEAQVESARVDEYTQLPMFETCP